MPIRPFQKGSYDMKRTIAFALTMLLLSASAAMAADGFPLTLAGITLGKDIKTFTACCDMQLASPMPDAPFLNEVHLKADYVPGVRGGSLTYANCNDIGKVGRIKLKFHDRSKDLFEKLLDKYTTAFGKPDSYQGDAFRNIIAWQWDFAKGDEKVALLLMWSRLKEMRPGVSIKMTLSSLVDSEYACFKEKFDKLEASKGGPSKIKSLDEYVPR